MIGVPGLPDPTLAPLPPGITYLGCWKDDHGDNGHNRGLPFFMHKNSGPRRCADACLASRYFALQDKGDCFCGDDNCVGNGNCYWRHGRAPDVECDNGDGVYQGGAWRNAVFEVANGTKSEGNGTTGQDSNTVAVAQGNGAAYTLAPDDCTCAQQWMDGYKRWHAHTPTKLVSEEKSGYIGCVNNQSERRPLFDDQHCYHVKTAQKCCSFVDSFAPAQNSQNSTDAQGRFDCVPGNFSAGAVCESRDRINRHFSNTTASMCPKAVAKSVHADWEPPQTHDYAWCNTAAAGSVTTSSPASANTGLVSIFCRSDQERPLGARALRSLPVGSTRVQALALESNRIRYQLGPAAPYLFKYYASCSAYA